ncbi:MAG: ATP-binding cassette domain-containing protein [Clostridia bacterium]|nr:ATP-binding cassette domain-containing protein [Clostridia bacterium]
MTALLSIRELSKSYKQVTALQGFSCDLDVGIHALLGPNGSGKSTLMNILTQNLTADGGEILFRGEAIASMGRHYRERIGFMPQNAGIPSGFTLQEFLMYMACLKDLPRREANRQAEELMEQVDLADCKNRKVGTFSGGMKQRALLAQALLGEPDLVILDEPTAGLDPMQRLKVKNLLAAHASSKCILIATHIVSDVEDLASRLLFLKKGRLAAEGSPEEMKHSLAKFFWDLPKEELTSRHRLVKLLPAGARVYSETKPSPGAKPALPDPEDCYYYHFGERSS